MKKRTPLSLYTDAEIISEAGKRRRKMQTEPPNPPVLRPCLKCGAEFGAREMRKHMPVCPKK